MSTNPFSKQNSPAERLRKPVSFIAIALSLLLAVFTVSRPFMTAGYEVLEFLGFFLLIAAALGRIWSSIYIAGRKNKELCQSGPYSLCRNPLYFFSFLGCLGFFLAIQNLALTVAVIAFFALYYRMVINSEERRLGHLFGNDFDVYINRVPRFWPSIRKPEGSGAILVHPRLIERGLLEVAWFLFAIIGAELLEEIHATNALWHFTLPF